MTSPAKQDQSSEELELHAHSPRRRADSMAGIQERMGAKMPTHPNMNRVIQPPMVMQSSAMQELSIENHSTAWNSLTQMPDPFVEGSRHLMHNHYAARSTKSDLSMPDYSQSITPSSSRNATNDFHGNVGPVGTVQSHETIFGDFPALFNADNDGISGVVAPANTRVSSATNTPPISSRPSAAAEARAASYSKERSRAISITTKDVPPKPRETSDVSMKSQFSEDIINSKETANTKLHTQPASEVKGRKEGRAAELDVPNHLQKKASNSSIGSTGSKKENTTARITTTIVLSDGKRKRTTTIPRLSSKDEEDLGSSPTVKAAKKKSSKTRLLDPVCAMGPMVDGKTDPRPPLGSIDNIL
ncbi:hypothetical protein MMC13_005016 [Lambiella insularis]|nr:hypothetical protein [Lambiella insularis]